MVTNDANWIVTQLQDGGMLEKAPHRIEVLNTISTLVKQGKYTHDRLVSSVTLGFWTYLFTKVPFRIGGAKYIANISSQNSWTWSKGYL